MPKNKLYVCEFCHIHKMKLQVIRKKNCTGLAEYEPTLTPLVTTWLYGTVFRFYFRNIVTVFIPFFLLAYLNIRIVSTLREQQRTASLFKFQCSEHKVSKSKKKHIYNG